MAVKSRNDYAAALKRAKAELARHNERGEALQKAVEALAVLAAGAAPARRAPVRRKAAAKPKAKARAKAKAAPKRRAKAAPKRKPANGRRRSTGAGHPTVPSGHYAGLGVTKAYRKFVAEFGGTKYSVPQIRDALVQGGVKSSTRAALLTGLHSVRRRDRLAAEKAGGGKKKKGGRG